MKGYGAVAVGKQWGWYEIWLNRVREECREHPDGYRTTPAATATSKEDPHLPGQLALDRS